MPLGKTLAFVIRNERTMVIRRLGESECTLEQQLASSRTQEIGSTNYFRYPHCSIVDDNCQLIGGNIVAAPDDEVAKITSGHELLHSEVVISELN